MKTWSDIAKGPQYTCKKKPEMVNAQDWTRKILKEKQTTEMQNSRQKDQIHSRRKKVQNLPRTSQSRRMHNRRIFPHADPREGCAHIPFPGLTIAQISVQDQLPSLNKILPELITCLSLLRFNQNKTLWTE